MLSQVLLFFHNSCECDDVIKSKPTLSEYLRIRGVTRLDGPRGKKHKFGAPMFQPDLIRKQIYSMEVRGTCDTVGTFLRPGSHLVPPQ